jgi:CHAT domain-containing protein
MRRFYQLVGGEELSDLSAALHQAQDWLRQLTVDEAQEILVKASAPIPPDWSRLAVESMPFAAPEFWAGFILVGQIRPAVNGPG